MTWNLLNVLLILSFSSGTSSISSFSSELDFSFSFLDSSGSLTDHDFDDRRPCIFRGVLKFHQEEFSLVRCSTCKCNNGTLACSFDTCPHPSLCKDSERVDIPGECCPKCPGIWSKFPLEHCFYRGEVLLHGQTVQSDSCTTCTCRSGTTDCEISRCPRDPPPCPPPMERTFVPDVCCPVCVSVCTATTLKWRLNEIERPFYGRETVIRLNVHIKFEESEMLEGVGMWRVGIFGSSSPDGSGPRLSEVEQTLDDDRAATAKKGTSLHIKKITADFELGSLGCDHVQYVCVEFAKGDAPDPPLLMYFNNDEEDHDDDGGGGGVYRTRNSLISCKEQTCTKLNRRRQQKRQTV